MNTSHFPHINDGKNANNAANNAHKLRLRCYAYATSLNNQEVTQ